MRITCIELTGTIPKGQRTPRAVAKLTRRPRSHRVGIAIYRSDGREEKHAVDAHDTDRAWALASALHTALEGDRGTNSDRQELLDVIRKMGLSG